MNAVYFANKYYSTMICSSFVILGDDINIINQADILFKDVIRSADNEKACDVFREFLADNDLMYFDDVNDVIEIDTADDGTEVLNGIYRYVVANNYSDRF